MDEIFPRMVQLSLLCLSSLLGCTLCMDIGRNGVYDSPMATDYYVQRFGFLFGGGRSGMHGLEALQVGKIMSEIIKRTRYKYLSGEYWPLASVSLTLNTTTITQTKIWNKREEDGWALTPDGGHEEGEQADEVQQVHGCALNMCACDNTWYLWTIFVIISEQWPQDILARHNSVDCLVYIKS